jgi:AraC family transcriptional regulator of adaptative response/methylated-DNA-[protein]-cysteine methyltransferase
MTRDERWRAVSERDRSFDGRFVFGVRTTGIYCRPSCPARRPRPSRVIFFAAPELARAAGFRPCLRCRPDEAGEDLSAQAGAAARMVRRVCRYLDAHWEEPMNLQTLAAATGASRHDLQRTFKRIVGISPREYQDALRLRRVKSQLRAGSDIAGALYDAGYGSSSRLYERAGAHLGMTPATYRKGGKGMSVGYTIVNCALGRMLVAATERGVSAVSFAESDEKLLSALREEYPQAAIHPEPNGLKRWVAAMVRHLESSGAAALDLPLDIRGTAFQRRVWKELQKIPRGETRTYTEVARRIGRPRAVRAVARACATNPVSVVIPCHRVVRADGSLGGYRWGLERKAKLLERERTKTN